MTIAEQRDYLSCAETAKLVRGALKREFPGTKFSVRSHTYAGGASIDVYWTDGPTSSAVSEIMGDYEGGRFDGMQDLAYHAEHWLTPDGIATVRRIYGHSHENETLTPDQPDEARLVHFGADYIFEHREVSPEWAAECSEGSAITLGVLNGSDYCPGCGSRFSGPCWAAHVPDPGRDTDRTRFTCSQPCAGKVIAQGTPRPAGA